MKKTTTRKVVSYWNISWFKLNTSKITYISLPWYQKESLYVDESGVCGYIAHRFSLLLALIRYEMKERTLGHTVFSTRVFFPGSSYRRLSKAGVPKLKVKTPMRGSLDVFKIRFKIRMCYFSLFLLSWHTAVALKKKKKRTHFPTK